MTEKELLELWLSEKKSTVKPSTLAMYRRICFQIILPYCGVCGLAEGCKILERTLPDKYSTKTTRDIVSIVNQIMNFAHQHGFISEITKLSLKLPPKARRVQVFSRYEQQVLTQYLLSNTDYSKLGVIVGLYTGLRLGEICGLQIKDIDLNSNAIRVTKTVQRICDGLGHSYHHIGSPKTDYSVREIPIPQFLLNLLKVNIENLSEDCYLASGTTEYVQPRTYQYRFKSYLRSCNLPEYHFHTLRHTFASRAVELGFDIKSLSEILGHSNVKITLNLYVHPSMEQKRAEMEKFSALA